MHIYCYQFSNHQITHIFIVLVITHSSIKIPTCLETTVYLRALLMAMRNEVVSRHLPSILREEIHTSLCLYHYIFLSFFFNSPPKDLIIQKNLHSFLFQHFLRCDYFNPIFFRNIRRKENLRRG